MLVSEGCTLNPSVVNIRISTIEGTDVWLAVDCELSCDALKIEAVSQLFEGSESSKTALYYNLLNVRTGRLVSDEQTLRLADIVDNDELLLIRRRQTPLVVPWGTQKENTAAPTAREIDEATANLPVRSAEHSRSDHPSNADFQTELKKILVSLIDVAQRLICLNADDFKEAKKYVFCHNSTLAHHCEVSSLVDEKAVQQLVEMGFDRARATKALLVNRMSHVRAIQWLCDNAVDAEEENSVEHHAETGGASDQPISSTDPSASDQSSVAAAAEEPSTETDDNIRRELFELAKLSGAAKVRRMLEAFKCYKRRVFKPDPGALQSLLEMGFDKGHAVDALRMFNNSKDEACYWLLNQGGIDACSSSPSAAAANMVDEGLDPESSIYKAIMANHVIQLSLTSHKTLIALLHILENPSSQQQWLRDSDLNPLLVQISRIYHAEKYGR
jgi:Kip1 ubiquitination-promoting complex protein 2